MRDKISALICLAFSVGMLTHTAYAAESSAEPDSCKQVRMADPGWIDITSTNAIVGIVLGALGYEQTVSNLSIPITYVGMKKGQIDVFLGNWMPAQKELIAPFVKEGSITVLHPNLQNAKFTLAVPTYVAEAGVKSFADLAKFVDKFDHKIYGIEPGSPANQNLKRMLDAKAFGLTGWTLVESSEQSMLSQVARKVPTKAWIAFLAWEPHQMNTRFPITYLDGGDAYFGAHYGSATVNTLTRKNYAAQCPNVGRLLTQMTFTVEMENAMINAILTQRIAAKDAALAQLKAHPEMLVTWLAGVKTRGGVDGLSAVKKKLEEK